MVKDTNKLFTDEELKNLLISGIINFDEVLEIKSMNRKFQKTKAMHPYPVHHTETSGWFTTVDDSASKSGKKKIRRSSETGLWEALSEWYIENRHYAQTTSISQLYEEWIDWKETPKNADNIARIRYEWKTYYLEEPLSKDIISKPIVKLTSLELRKWAESLLKKYKCDKKKYARIFLIVNQVLEYAADEDVNLIPENIWTKAKKKINKDLIYPEIIPEDNTQVFTDEERQAIWKMVYEDLEVYKQKPTSAGLQILFLFETGLRIGECCGLKWSDVQNGRLYIRRQANNERVKEWTKSNTSARDIPLTRRALKILEDVKNYNAEHGFSREWIFQSDNPKYDYRLSYNAADRKLRKLCVRLDSVVKSPHKCRKTCISTLLDNPNVNNKTVQRFAGHKDFATTQRYYNFDRSDKQEQAEAIDLALAI